MRPIDRIASKVRKCTLCRLSKGRMHAVPGEGPCPAKIMFIGQAPGRNEDKTGRPFVGMAGRFLDGMMKRHGIERRRVFITSVVKCFPPKNRAPKEDEILACNPYLKAQIKLVRPKLIVLLGNIASRTVLGKGFLRGMVVKTNGASFLPTVHPAAAMRFPKMRALMEKDFSSIARLPGTDL